MIRQEKEAIVKSSKLLLRHLKKCGLASCILYRYVRRSKLHTTNKGSLTYDCIIYTNQIGRPRSTINKHTATLAKVVFIHVYGYPNNMVLHKCDNKFCWKLEHLYDGTALDTARDAAKNGITKVIRYRLEEHMERADYLVSIKDTPWEPFP